MKKFSLIIGILFTFLGLSSYANHNHSDLNVQLWNNTSFKIILDNEVYDNTTNFYIKNLSVGYHSLRVVKMVKNHNDYGNIRQILFNGKLNIPFNSKVIATVTPNRKIKLNIVKKQIYSSNNNNSCGNTNSYYGNNGYEYNCMNNNYGNNYIMSNYNFNKLMQIMAEASFGSSKLSIVKQALSRNNFSTDQIVLLSRQFTFDSDKLEFAKLAYSKTVDKQNYFLVSNEFTFDRSMEKLNNYVNSFG